MKNHRIFICAICLFAVALGLPALGQEPAPVTVAQPEVRPAVDRVELTGSFTARRAAQLSPRLSGLVETISIDAGDTVEAGDVVVRLDDSLAQLQLAQAVALVAQARAAFDEAVRLRDEAERLGEDKFLPNTLIQARKSAVHVAKASLDVAGADAVLVPRDALIRYPDGTITVFVLDDAITPPKVRQRQVVIGRAEGDMAVIESGLDAGQPVVVRGNEALNDDDIVRVVSE